MLRFYHALTNRGNRLGILFPWQSRFYLAARQSLLINGNNRFGIFCFCAHSKTTLGSTTTRRRLSTDDDSIIINRKSSSGSLASVESANATTEWKRSHYRKIHDKFQQPQVQHDDGCDNSTKENQQQPEPPLIIDNYEDVQPMWKGMESRVTKRAALTLEQRGGVSGRRNVRKSEEDMWLESGMYDIDKSDK